MRKQSDSILLTITIVFICFKLLNLIDWNWFWVLSPLWLPFLIITGSVLIMAVIGFVIECVKSIWRN